MPSPLANRHTRCQGAIMRGSQILLIRHRNHEDGRTYWLLPGGGLEPGETPEVCVRREMQEETGLDVRVESLLDAYDSENPRRMYKRYLTFLCTPVGGEAAPGYEPEPEAASLYAIVEVRWVDLWDESGWDESMLSDGITTRNIARIRSALQASRPSGGD